MRALITNDDGISSVGIRTLAEVALAAGLDVTVAAPVSQRRRYGTALSALEDDGTLIVGDHELEGLGLTGLAVQASPAMIVFVAARGAFGDPPDVVLSGINHGANTGQAVLHSGTVGAALTAASLGIPAMAVSLGTEGWTEWGTAAHVSRRTLDWFLAGPAHDTKAPYVLNVNVPDIPAGRVRGLRQAALASFGAVQAEVGVEGADYATVSFTQLDDEGEAGTDVALLRNGWATVTPLQPPTTVTGVDLSGLH